MPQRRRHPRSKAAARTRTHAREVHPPAGNESRDLDRARQRGLRKKDRLPALAVVPATPHATWAGAATAALRRTFRRTDTADYFHDRIGHRDRKSTRLNSSHRTISYAVFCLKKKKNP